MFNKLKERGANLIWKVLENNPNFKKKIFRFYAWRIFEFFPFFKKMIYQIYDKFWYLELLVDTDKFDVRDFQNNNYIIASNRLNYFRYIQNPNKSCELDLNWDLSNKIKIIDESDEYHLLIEHFINGKDWKEIKYYSKIIEQFLNSHVVNGYTNENDFLNSLYTLDNLYKELKALKPEKKIIVGIGRDGNYIIFEGLLTFLLLKILNQEEIPIEIVVRHPQWIKFSKEFLRFQYLHGEIYHPLIHPDLTLKSSYTDERYNIIKDNLSFNKGTLLDIGANLGFFCHKFEELGFDCYAVEVRPSNAYFMKKLRDIEKKKFTIINKSIFDYKEKFDFDIVLALNIFHHFLREKDLYYKLIKFLRNLKIKEMYFQPHNPNEKIMQTAYINYDNIQFVNFIINNSCLNQFEQINYISDGKKRPLYKLTL
ncbi:MAG: hypothetical protein ACFFD5_12045 [Candidatus Thorarchaeota archaeon]